MPRNPASSTTPPKLSRKEMKFYNEAQIRTMLETIKAEGDRYLALFHLALTTGMRQAELLGLKWTDLDWNKGTLQIKRQLKRKKGGGFYYPPPKSKAGYRTLVLGQKMLAILKEHQALLQREQQQAKQWHFNDLMFPNTFGNPTQPDKLLKRFKRLCEKANLPLIRFHDLRHTSATLMLNHGVPIIVVSRRLGHAQPSITLDVYGHLLPVMQNEVAELMDQITAL